MDIQPGLLLAIIAIAVGLSRIFKGPVGDALAERIRTRREGHEQEMRAEMDALRSRLAEVEERLDFTERLLAQADAADQLHGRVER